MSFGAQLKNARKSKGLTQKELAVRIGAKHNSISNWEKDQNRPGSDMINALCRELSITPNDLFEEQMNPPAGYQNLPETVKIPIVGRIACGAPITAETNIEGYVDVPIGMHADFCLVCSGESMIDAGIHDGDLVYIRQQPTVENGQIAAVRIDDEATLKRVYQYKDRIVLQPANNLYPPLVFMWEEMNTIHIEGKAVGYTHWF